MLEELIAAIWAAPWDDTPRLVYADALERTDPARAEFIRVQCGLARPDLDRDTRARLERVQRDLWQRHRRTFRRGLADRIRGQEFSRGFSRPTFKDLSTIVLLRDLLPLFPSAPAWSIQIKHASHDELRAFYQSEHLARVDQLEVTHIVLLEELVESPYCCNVVDLRMPYARMPAPVERLGAAMPHLRRLALPSSGLAEDSARFAASELAPRLEYLDLDSNRLDATHVEQLFATDRFSKLSALDFYGCQREDVVLALIASARLPALERLSLGGDLTDATAHALARWSGARTLKRLSVTRAMLGRDALAALLESPNLAGLEELTINTRAETLESLCPFVATYFPTATIYANWAVVATR